MPWRCLLCWPFLAACAVAQPLPDKVVWAAEDPAGVEGLERETERVKEGAAAVRWRNHPTVSSITLPQGPTDWTGYHLLRFEMYSAKALPARIMVILGSENPETEGSDYYGFAIGLGFEGWQTIEIPINQGAGARQPRGWDQIDAVTLTVSGWGNNPHPEADLVLDDFRLVWDPPRPGPLLSDADFFADLDLQRPELKAVKQAVDAGDLEQAKAALLQHFRDRATPRWWFDWRARPEAAAIAAGGSDGWDYFGSGLNVDWEGWRTITIPLAQFGRSREPIGWHYITYLSFSATYGDRVPSAELRLAFDDITLVGPTEQVLDDFEDGRGLEAWGLARSDDLADGTVGLWAQPRSQGSVTRRDVPLDWSGYTALRFKLWSGKATGDRITVIANSDTPDLSGADRVVAHYHGSTFLGEDIDWNTNAREPGDPAFTKEWTYNVNRFGSWETLGRAYWQSGDEKYAKEWIAQMRDWVEDNPYPRFGTGNDTLTWRTIEAGIRTSGSWVNTLYYFLGSPSLTGDDLTVFLKSWMDHGRHLMRITLEHPEHGGNWVTMECNGLGHLGVLFPEAKDAPNWRQTATNRLLDELDRQVYPDGAQKELTTGYHQVALRNFVELLKIARHNGGDLPAAYVARLERLYDYNLKVMTPDTALPPVNDAGYTQVRGYLADGAELFGRDDFKWAGSGRTAGTPPNYTSIALPYAGQYIMRSGWESDDLYGFFESGPYGIGHQHEDKLSLWLYGLGRVLLTEGGTYSYDASVWRKYVLGTWAHNTILVDGQEQRRRAVRESFETDAPLDNLWVTNELFDAADGIYEDGYGRDAIPVRHERTVVFLKPDYWLVLDRLHGTGAHGYDILWHLNNEEAGSDPASQSAWGADPDVANLLVTPLRDPGLKLEIVKGREDPPLGWGEMRRRTPAPALDYQYRATGDATLAWVLTPFRLERPQVAVKVDAVAGGSLVTVTRPGGEDQVFIAERGKTGTVELGGQALTGRVAVRRGDGRVAAE